MIAFIKKIKSWFSNKPETHATLKSDRNSRIVKNKKLLRDGHILVNKHGFTVKLDPVTGNQIRSNPNRKSAYSMDDESWEILESRDA